MGKKIKKIIIVYFNLLIDGYKPINKKIYYEKKANN